MHSPTSDDIVARAGTEWIPDVRASIRCAVIYGSRAALGAEVRPDSDVDLFVVTRQEANPATVVESAVDYFAGQGLRCDPFWYVESYFFRTLDAGIDFTLWHEVFHLGRTLHADDEFLDRVSTAFRNVSPLESLSRTILARRQRESEHTQALIRNTDRILTEAILIAYCEATGVSDWTDLVEARSLVSTALKAGAIDRSIQTAAESLARMKRQRIGATDESALGEFTEVRLRFVKFVDDQLRRARGS